MTIEIDTAWVGPEDREAQSAHLSISLPPPMKAALQAASEADGEDNFSRWIRTQLVGVLERLQQRLTPVQAPLAARQDGREGPADGHDPNLVGTEINHPLSGYDGWTYDDWHRFGGENSVWRTMLGELL